MAQPEQEVEEGAPQVGTYVVLIADIGVGGSALAGFVVALVFSGWRQRRNERRIYREQLLAPS